jgi:hypothetical protein
VRQSLTALCGGKPRECRRVLLFDNVFIERGDKGKHFVLLFGWRFEFVEAVRVKDAKFKKASVQESVGTSNRSARVHHSEVQASPRR